MDNLFENAEYNSYACNLDNSAFSNNYEVDLFDEAMYRSKYIVHDLSNVSTSPASEMMNFLSRLHANGSFFVIGNYGYNDIVDKRNCRVLKFQRSEDNSYGLFKSEILENQIRYYPSELMYYAMDDDDWYWYENKDHIGSFFDTNGKEDFLIILKRIKEKKYERTI